MQLVKLAVIWTQARQRYAHPSQLDGCTAAEEGFKDTKSALCEKIHRQLKERSADFPQQGIQAISASVRQSAQRDLVAFLVAAGLGGAKSCSSKLAVIDAVAGRRME